MRRLSITIAAVAMLATTACSQLGSLGNILGALGGIGGQQRQQQVQAEVQQLDARNGVLYIRTRSGESGSVRVDNQTQVIYRQRQYPVTALQPGDIVVLTLQQVQQNQVYASRIDVQQTASERR